MLEEQYVVSEELMRLINDISSLVYRISCKQDYNQEELFIKLGMLCNMVNKKNSSVKYNQYFCRLKNNIYDIVEENKAENV